MYILNIFEQFNEMFSYQKVEEVLYKKKFDFDNS